MWNLDVAEVPVEVEEEAEEDEGAARDDDVVAVTGADTAVVEVAVGAAMFCLAAGNLAETLVSTRHCVIGVNMDATPIDIRYMII